MVRLAVAEAAQKGANSTYVPKILAAVAKLLRDDEASAREAAANALRRLCGEHPEAVAPHLAAFLPQLAEHLFELDFVSEEEETRLQGVVYAQCREIDRHDPNTLPLADGTSVKYHHLRLHVRRLPRLHEGGAAVRLPV